MGKRKKKKPQKNNKFDNLSQPQATFDFHDRGILSHSKMRELCDEFLEQCLNRKLNKILIITGKGLHSRKGSPVVKPFIKKYLSSHPQVHNIYEGRRDRGGAGTLEVILKY